MRNVIFAINITLDGCCDHTKVIADEETHEYFTNLLRDVDLQVFGRKTYQLMVPFWPEVAKSQSMTKASNEFAQLFDSINKLVFSRSLDSAEARNTRIVRTNHRDEILKLIGLAPKDLQVNISQEVRKIFMCFFISNYFGVVAAAVQGNVDGEEIGRAHV